MVKRIFLLAFISFLSKTISAQVADRILMNANVYTVNPNQPWAQAVAVQGEKILFVGSDLEAKKYADTKTELIDCKGQFLIPGLIEGHGHIHGMGASLINLNLMKAKNWEEIVSLVEAAAKKAKPGDWIIGRGWHQEKWDHAPSKNHLGYPYHEELDNVSKNNPVLLTHASGHSAYINLQAMKLAGITDKTTSPAGGDVVKDNSGKFVGVLEEKAQSIFFDV